jgi:hypothetical protein
MSIYKITFIIFIIALIACSPGYKDQPKKPDKYYLVEFIDCQGQVFDTYRTSEKPRRVSGSYIYFREFDDVAIEVSYNGIHRITEIPLND